MLIFVQLERVSPYWDRHSMRLVSDGEGDAGIVITFELFEAFSHFVLECHFARRGLEISLNIGNGDPVAYPPVANPIWGRPLRIDQPNLRVGR